MQHARHIGRGEILMGAKLPAQQLASKFGCLLRNSEALPRGRTRASDRRRYPWPFPACRYFPNPQCRKRDRHRTDACAVSYAFRRACKAAARWSRRGRQCARSKMCSGNFQPSTLKHVISAQATVATNSVSGPISNGGAVPNSPRHSRTVRTCWSFSSSTYATMHSTSGKLPSSISYSKSATTTLAEVFTRRHDTGLLCSDQPQQARMIRSIDHAGLRT